MTTFSSSCLVQVFNEYLSGLTVDTGIFIDTSTVMPATAKRLAAAAAERHVHYVSCPVFGRPDAAATGSLIACLAGATATLRHSLIPLVASFASKLFTSTRIPPIVQTTMIHPLPFRMPQGVSYIGKKSLQRSAPVLLRAGCVGPRRRPRRCQLPQASGQLLHRWSN
jgi:hypothetical protein